LFKATSSFKNFKFLFRLCNRLDAVVVQTNKSRRFLIDSGVNKNKIFLINSPINIDKFRSIKKNKLNQKEKVILYYGHFNRFKGVEHLIKSLNYLKTAKYRLILIPSDDNQKNYYDNLIVKEKCEDKVTILSAKTDIVKQINSADVVVLPYPSLISTESNPSCMLEVMSCKTPLITSDLEELRELVKHKESALLAKPENPKDIAKNIDLILTNKKLQKKIVANAFKISKSFDVKQISDQYDELFSSLINKIKV